MLLLSLPPSWGLSLAYPMSQPGVTSLGSLHFRRGRHRSAQLDSMMGAGGVGFRNHSLNIRQKRGSKCPFQVYLSLFLDAAFPVPIAVTWKKQLAPNYLVSLTVSSEKHSRLKSSSYGMPYR